MLMIHTKCNLCFFFANGKLKVLIIHKPKKDKAYNKIYRKFPNEYIFFFFFKVSQYNGFETNGISYIIIKINRDQKLIN